MLTVYVAGLVYFNGCKQPVKRMFAPDGTEGEPPHYAFLWIAADLLEESATQWWDGFSVPRDVDGVAMVEFRIPEPAEISFPDGDPGTCKDLDNKLPKLKKKQQDGTEENYEVDPATAETIAEATISSGTLTPRRFKNMGLVEWTIANPSTLQITTTLKDNPSDSRTITLKPAAEGGPMEVVFANTHDLFGSDTTEVLDDDHDLALFTKLNSALANVTLVSKKAPGSVGQLKTGNPVMNRLRFIKYSGGDPPNCCHD